MTRQTRAEKMQQSIEAADYAAALTREFVLDLHESEGVSLAVLLAGAHAEIVAMLVLELGGDVTALSLRAAADSVAHKPSLSDVHLAMMPTAGRA